MNITLLNISLVIPLYNEAESLPELHDWIVRVMQKHDYSYEIIFIDDGSKDGSWQVIEQLKSANPNIRGVKFRRNYGKSAGLNVGFEHTRGDVIITMDADLQDSPEEIPELYRMIKEEGFDLVSGWKKKRYDPISKTIPTKLYNYVTSKMSGVHLHDMNCGLKAYRSDVVKNIEVYGEMHRYIPVIAKWAGFTKIGEKVVQHQARKYGVTKFGLSRFIYGPLDLFSIMFMGKFGKNGRFMTHALAAFTADDLRDFFLSIGVETIARDGFRVFPADHSSSIILKSLDDEIARLNIEVQCSVDIQTIQKISIPSI